MSSIENPIASNAATIVGGVSRLLGKLVGANFNVTTDNTMPINSSNYIVTAIYVTNASTSLTLAAGGVYSAASKGGDAIVAAAQVYSALTAATVVLPLTLAAVASAKLRTETSLFLNLTTGQGSAATADIYVYGYTLS